MANSYSKSAYIKLSPPLLRENLRNYWAIPAFGLLYCFFTIIFPLLMEMGNNSAQSIFNDFRSIASGASGIIVYVVLFPLIASVALSTYLQKSNAASTMHSLPLTRGRLFTTNTLSGLIMVIVPVVLTFLALQILLPAELLIASDGVMFSAADIATVRAGLWVSMGMSVLLCAFYLLLFNTAAQLVGNVPMHLIMSMFLAAVPAMLVLAVGWICGMTLYGFTLSETFALRVMALAPAVYVPVQGITYARGSWSTVAGIPVAAVIGYIIATLALYPIGALLYAKRSVERAGDSLVFKFIEIIFVSIVTLGGALTLGAIFSLTGWGAFPWNTGLLVGSVIAYFIAKMVATKSLRVFGGKSLLHLGATAACIAALLLLLQLDAFGYVKRVPKSGDIGSAKVTLYIGGMNGGEVANGRYDGLTFSDPENIAALLALHSKIVSEDNNSKYANGHYPYSVDSWIATIGVTYDRKDGGVLSRSWTFDSSLIIDDPNLHTLLKSGEYRAQNSLKTWAEDTPGIGDISVNYSDSNGGYYNSVFLQPREFNEFIELLDADRVEQGISFETYPGQSNAIEQSNDYPKLSSSGSYSVDSSHTMLLSVYIQRNNDENGNNSHFSDDFYYMKSISLEIPETCTRTYAWLTERGYFEELTRPYKVGENGERFYD